MAPQAKTIQQMEDTVKECLDSIPLDQICQSVLILLFLFTSHNSLPHLGLLIEPCVSLQLTGRGFQVPKPHGQTRDITGTELLRTHGITINLGYFLFYACDREIVHVICTM